MVLGLGRIHKLFLALLRLGLHDHVLRLLFRIVYLRALRAHCNDLPVVANLAFVPQKLEDVWVPQVFRLKPISAGKGAIKEENRRFYRTFDEVLAAGTTRIVVEGAAGSGKSTQLRKFVLDRISALLNSENFHHFLDEPLPIYLSAADLLEERGDRASSLDVAVRSSMGLRLPFRIPSGFFDRRQAGAPKSLLLVVDGVNEIEATKLGLLPVRLTPA